MADFTHVDETPAHPTGDDAGASSAPGAQPASGRRPARKNRGAKRHGSRYKARRRAVDLLFEAEARDIDPVALADERAVLSRDQDNQVSPISEYTKQIVAGVAVELDSLDDCIEQYLTDDWQLYRIPAVDRAILRLSMWELVFNPDVPVKTAVVEGTELASQYSGLQAARYINAMLDRVSRNLDQLRGRYVRTEEQPAEVDPADDHSPAGSDLPTSEDTQPITDVAVIEPDGQTSPLEVAETASESSTGGAVVDTGVDTIDGDASTVDSSEESADQTVVEQPAQQQPDGEDTVDADNSVAESAAAESPPETVDGDVSSESDMAEARSSESTE